MCICYFLLLHTLVLRLDFTVAKLAAGCTVASEPLPPVCPETCSKPTRIPHGKDFTCTVIKESKNISDFLDSCTTSTECIIPVLTRISLHALPYSMSSKYSPSLNVSFNVSFHRLAKTVGLKAVLLEFESPIYTTADKKKYTDAIFSTLKDDKITKRLFDFSTFEPDYYDVENPMTIDFPCIYGLDDCQEGKIYTITLTSVMKALNSSEENVTSDSCILCSQTYTVSVTPTRYNNWNGDKNTIPMENSEHWKMTIATTFFPSERDLNIVIEKPNITFDYYCIRLVKNRNTVREKNTTDLKETSVIFKSVPRGNYTVQVLLCYRIGVCKYNYTTYHTIVIKGKVLLKTVNSTEIVLTSLIASFMGVALASFLLILLVWCRRSNSKNTRNAREIEEPSYVILSGCDSTSIGISHVLTLALTGLGLQNVHCPCTNSEALEYIENNANAYLLILLPVEHKTFHFQISKDTEYEQMIKSILSTCKKLKNMLLIYFPYMKGAKRIHWGFLRKCKGICLMNDYEKMLKLLKVKTTDSRILEKVRSDLIKATEEAKQALISYFHTKLNTNVIVENIEMCSIHSPQQTICPVHDTNLHSMQPRQCMCQCTEEGHWFNNNSLRNDEISPFLDPVEDIIPPSPMPRRNIYPFQAYQIIDSGYSPSRINSSTSNNNERLEEETNKHESLEDDDSLIEGMIMVNSSLLPQNCQTDPKMSTENHSHIQYENGMNEDIDRAFKINFF